MKNKETSSNQQSAHLNISVIGSNALSIHFNNSAKAWHNWNKKMPMNVEVICKEISKRYGKFLTVQKWIIVPPESGFKECLVAEFNIKTNYFGKSKLLRLHIKHLIPAKC